MTCVKRQQLQVVFERPWVNPTHGKSGTDLPGLSVMGVCCWSSHCSEVTLRRLPLLVDSSSQVRTIELPSGLVKRSWRGRIDRLYSDNTHTCKSHLYKNFVRKFNAQKLDITFIRVIGLYSPDGAIVCLHLFNMCTFLGCSCYPCTHIQSVNNIRWSICF